MTLHGTIRSGVVVLEGGAALPEGTPVTVVVEQAQAATAPAQAERMTEDHRRKLLAAMDAIAALPIEGSKEPFSGRDHDQVLYGKP